MYETVPVKAVRVFILPDAVCFSKTNRNEICMEPCETCMMSDVVWYKNNPGESEITHEAACQT